MRPTVLYGVSVNSEACAAVEPVTELAILSLYWFVYLDLPLMKSYLNVKLRKQSLQYNLIFGSNKKVLLPHKDRCLTSLWSKLPFFITFLLLQQGQLYI